MAYHKKVFPKKCHIIETLTKGRFPIEIKTKIRYLIICGYHNFLQKMLHNLYKILAHYQKMISLKKSCVSYKTFCVDRNSTTPVRKFCCVINTPKNQFYEGVIKRLFYAKSLLQIETR